MLLICCGYCKTDIAVYQKVGKGNLLRMYIERIVHSAIDLSRVPGALFCPNCRQQLATRTFFKNKAKTAYIMVRGAFNAKKFQ